MMEQALEPEELPAAPETESPDPSSGNGEQELLEALRVLDDSQAMIRTILLGISLQYRSLDLQRQLLLCQAEDPDFRLCGPSPQEVQTAASLIVLYALFGFQQQALRLTRQATQRGGCPDMMEVKLSATVILIALIRLARLQNQPAGRSLRQEETTLEEDPSGAAGDI